MVNDRAAASGEKRIDLSEQIPWFCDILIVGPFIEIGPRLLFDKSAVGDRQYPAKREVWSARS